VQDANFVTEAGLGERWTDPNGAASRRELPETTGRQVPERRLSRQAAACPEENIDELWPQAAGELMA